MPQQINEKDAERFGVVSGWWAVDKIGAPVLGSHHSRKGTLVDVARRGRHEKEEESNNNNALDTEPAK